MLNVSINWVVMCGPPLPCMCAQVSHILHDLAPLARADLLIGILLLVLSTTVSLRVRLGLMYFLESAHSSLKAVLLKTIETAHT